MWSRFSDRRARRGISEEEDKGQRVRADLRNGMDDEALSEKYFLTRDQFHMLLRKAVDSGLIHAEELHARLSHSRTAITRAFVEMQEAVSDLSSVTAVVDSARK